MVKKIIFILVLVVGAIAIGISFYLYSATSEIAEYLALYTSISTACYAILTQSKERTEPFLRITPVLDRHHGMVAGKGWSTRNTAGIKIWIENVGYSNATNIELKCQLTVDTELLLENKGIFRHPLLAPNEAVYYQALEIAEIETLFSQKLTIEAVYSNEDNKKQKPIKMECEVRELEDHLREVKTK